MGGIGRWVEQDLTGDQDTAEREEVSVGSGLGYRPSLLAFQYRPFSPEAVANCSVSMHNKHR